MSTAVIIIIFIVALILSVGFLVLVLTLVPAINQLRSLFIDIEKTSTEIRDVARELKKVGKIVEDKSESLDDLLERSKRAAETLRSAFNFINKKILKRSAGFFALFPAIKFGWNLVKKTKGGKK